MTRWSRDSYGAINVLKIDSHVRCKNRFSILCKSFRCLSLICDSSMSWLYSTLLRQNRTYRQHRLNR